jgi:hypothetical protein
MKKCFIRPSTRAPILGFLSLAFAAAGCSTPYLVKNFEREYKPITKTFAIGPITVPHYLSEAKSNTEPLRKAIYEALIARQDQYFVQIQTLEETRQKTEEAKLTDSAFAELSPLGLCQVLGVDAVLRGKLVIYRKENMVSSILLGTGSDVAVEVAVNHKSMGQMVWHYQARKQGGRFGKPAALLDDMGRKIAGNFPFRK